MDKMRGRIKSLKKNYGFIGGSDAKDYFFHWSFLADSTKTFSQLEVGNTVEFIPMMEQEKARATQIIAVD
jgi:cold shock CspA family protein